MDFGLIGVVVASLALIISLLQFLRTLLKEHSDQKTSYQEWLDALYKEIRNNLTLVENLLKQDLKAGAVYNEVIRNTLSELRYTALSKAKGYKKWLKNDLVKKGLTSEARQLYRLFGYARRPLENLDSKLRILPINPTKGAPIIKLSVTIPSLKDRLTEINAIFKKLRGF